MPVTILIADGDPAVRERVKRLLGHAVGIVSECDGADAAVQLAIEPPHRIKQERPETRVILLTVHDEEAYLSATGKSGADAFLPKRLIRSHLLSTIREVGPGLQALWNGMERREGPARPRAVPGWD